MHSSFNRIRLEELTIRDGVSRSVVLTTLSNTNLSVGLVGKKIVVSDLELFVLWKAGFIHRNNQPFALSKKMFNECLTRA